MPKLTKYIDSSYLDKAKAQVNHVINRAMDKHMQLAVTGLSGAGKTAFITSLVNQLTFSSNAHELPFFSVLREGRFLGAKRALQPNMDLSRFEYADAMKSLTAENPTWPPSTRNMSQIRVDIRYRPEASLLKHVTDISTMHLDIYDYPGEWLLDLPLMDMSFEQWCRQVVTEMERPGKHKLARGFLSHISTEKLLETIDEKWLIDVSSTYRDYLSNAKTNGYHLIQPGRFVLPGDLEGAPVLEFFPAANPEILAAIDWKKVPEDSNLAHLIKRYEYYKVRVVKPFFEDYFSRFDRQLVLVDCLNALNKGHDAFEDMQHALSLIMKSFDYGQGGIISRLFSPKIDKLLFVATKVDQISTDQQDNLLSLLNHSLHQVCSNMRYEGIEPESMAVASVRATESGVLSHQGKSVHCVQGMPMGKEEMITLFPGEVPGALPKKSYFDGAGFNFPSFKPITVMEGNALPHIRMDKILEFAVGDKLL